jgi:hypothetical protein
MPEPGQFRADNIPALQNQIETGEIIMAVTENRQGIKTGAESEFDRGVGATSRSTTNVTAETMSTGTILAIIVAAIVVIGGGYYYFAATPNASTTPAITQTAPAPDATPVAPVVPAPDATVTPSAPPAPDAPAPTVQPVAPDAPAAPTAPVAPKTTP